MIKTMTAVVAGEIDDYRSLEPKSMLEETKKNIETPWTKKTRENLGTRPANLQSATRCSPKHPCPSKRYARRFARAGPSSPGPASRTERSGVLLSIQVCPGVL